MLSLKQTVFSLAIVTIVAATSSNAMAQDEASKNLQQALGALQGGSVHLSANIEIEKPKADKKKNGMMGMVMSVSSSDTTAMKSFAGRMDVHMADDGTIAAASTKGLPQVKVMYNGKRSVFSQTYASEAYDLPKLLSLVRGTLDVKGLVKEVSRAKRVRVSDSDGKKSYRVTIDGDFFKVSDVSADDDDPKKRIMRQAMGKMQPRIMEGVFTMDVDAAGKPTNMKYVLQYNDPMKAMMSQVMVGGGPGGAGGGAAIKVLGMGGGKQPKDIPGNKVVISYDVLTGSAGPAEEFAKQATEMLQSSAN